ncbi:radical SAM protein [Rhodocytophaga rosea]|uniref:Radical SAM protein n=1 Tax=Rhodocytophaga rosea TaxID=2704465 RepID=A0A6C0GKD4_9BACT|nr:radical SAM protein [Rhodocytophaga rosea]QHT68419.1 radical SAM protein [Rhodocytophaga rosea]
MMSTHTVVAPATLQLPEQTVYKADGMPSLPHFQPTILQSPLRRYIANRRLRFRELMILISCMPHPIKLYKALQKIAQLRELYFGQSIPKKLAYVGGRYYWGFHSPGWPSHSFTEYLTHTIQQLEPQQPDERTLHMAFVAITKKCPLACEHCFEWDNLNKREKLSVNDLKKIVSSLQEKKIAQIHFSGGEPMLRMQDMMEVMRTAKPGTDFWVITSGYHFTADNAQLLKKAGLTGVSVSLDHYLAAEHNAFRHYNDAFDNAIQAVGHAHQAGLVVSLSLCVTQNMASEEHLMQYARLANQLGVAFIQLLEPRAVGHYAGRPVSLTEDQVQVLHRFYEKLNFDPAFDGWPIITFHGYHQRRAGCSGAGFRFLYIDTDGDVHACPFCQKKSGSAINESMDTCLNRLSERGCHVFEQAKNLVEGNGIRVK